MKRMALGVVVVVVLVAGVQGESINMEFVNIGYAGNVADSSGYGAVGYNYRMGKYEVTVEQYMAVRPVGDERYWNDGIRTVGTGAPACNVEWYEAARFCNWLTTGDVYAGAYQFSQLGNFSHVNRAAAMAAYGTVYVLPTEDEWYKAAYYKPVNDGSYSLYASGLDSTPIHGTTNGWNYSHAAYVNGSPNETWESGFGGEEQNGTYDMMGNVWEWCENEYEGSDAGGGARVFRGGGYGDSSSGIRSSSRLYYGSERQRDNLGFRVAAIGTAIPEPSSIAMIGLVSGCVVFIRRFFMV